MQSATFPLVFVSWLWDEPLPISGARRKDEHIFLIPSAPSSLRTRKLHAPGLCVQHLPAFPKPHKPRKKDPDSEAPGSHDIVVNTNTKAVLHGSVDLRTEEKRV